MKVVLFLSALIAVCLAQSYPYTLTALTGGPVTQTFAATDNPYFLHVFSLSFNESITSLELTISQDTTTCDFWIYASGQEIPCGSLWDEGDDILYPCRGNSGSYDTIYSNPDSFFLWPSSNSDDMLLVMGRTVYVSLTRYPSSGADTCTYTIEPVVQSCPAGEVGAIDSSSYLCFNLTVLDNGVATTNFTYVFTPRLASSSDDWNFYRIYVPPMTGSIHFVGNLTGNAYIYISQRTVPSYYYDIREFGSYDSDGDVYMYDTWMFNPEAGYVYVAFEDAIVTDGYIVATLNICSGTMGGWNCSYPVNAVTSPDTPVTATVTITNTADDIPFHYFVLSTTATSVSFVNYTVTVSQGDSFVYYRKNGYADDESYNYVGYRTNVYNATGSDVFTVALTPAELAFPGQFVMGVRNFYSDAGRYVVATLSSTSSGGSTSGDATTGDTGATTTGSASSVAYCFALIALCIAALF